MKKMKNIFTIPAFIWAFICVLIIPVSFIGSDYFAQQLSYLPFMKVNPKYTGGEIARIYEQDSMIITVNKPVFPSLFGSGSKGFVQVKFSGVKTLPVLINQKIDYDNDGKADFFLNINTLTSDVKFETLSENVSALYISSKVKDSWIVRVSIMNPDKK